MKRFFVLLLASVGVVTKVGAGGALVSGPLSPVPGISGSGTNGVNTITAGTGISVSGTTNVTVTLTTPVTLANGGTGQTTAAADANVFGIFALANNVPAADSAGYTGQWGISPNGYVYKSTGIGAGQWAGQGLTILGGAGFGDPTRMSSDYGASLALWYTAGRADAQNVGQAGRNMQITHINCNPFDTGSGFTAAYIGTNTNSGAVLISTNTSGQKVYIKDLTGASYLMTPQGLQDNDLPSTQLIINDGFPTAIAYVTTVGGVIGNYSSLYHSASSDITYFPEHLANAWNPLSNNWSSPLLVDHQNNFVGAYNLNTSNTFKVNNLQWNFSDSSNGSNEFNFAVTHPASSGSVSNVTVNGRMIFQAAGTAVAPIFQNSIGGGIDFQFGNFSIDFPGVRGMIFEPAGNDLAVNDIFVPSGIPVGIGVVPTANTSLTVQSNAVFNQNVTVTGRIDIGSTGQTTFTASGVGTTQTFNVTQTNGFVIGAAQNDYTGHLVATNFISGQLYTNNTGRPIQVHASVVLTSAAVSGNCTMQLQVTGTGGSTNASGMATTALSIAMNYTNVLSGFVPPLGTYVFTNVSAGAGDSAAMLSGSGQYIVH